MIINSKVSFSIDGQTFKQGEHVLGKEVTEHWYFKALVADGSITVIKDDVEVVEVQEVSTKRKKV